MKKHDPQPVTRWADLGDVQPITLQGVPGMYYAPHVRNEKTHMICLTRLTSDGSAIYHRGPECAVPGGLMTAGPAVEVPEEIRNRCEITVCPES